MRNLSLFVCGTLLAGSVMASSTKLTPFNNLTNDAPKQIVLKNDTYNEQGGQVWVEQGFVKGEKAGVWVKVPKEIKLFRADFFRVLITNGTASSDTNAASNLQVFFQMATGTAYMPSIPTYLENAAEVTPGNYWNDIPAKNAEGKMLNCAEGGQLVGASIEFTHDGLPSVGRDAGPINAQANVLMDSNRGWNYSQAYGLVGNWILRVVGHEATAAECKN